MQGPLAKDLLLDDREAGPLLIGVAQQLSFLRDRLTLCPRHRRVLCSTTQLLPWAQFVPNWLGRSWNLLHKGKTFHQRGKAESDVRQTWRHAGLLARYA